MKQIQLLLIILITLLSACSARTSDSYALSEEEYSSTNADDITVFFDDPDRKYIVIGLIKSRGVDAAADNEESIQALKEEAAGIGANAVIIMPFQTSITTGQNEDAAVEDRVLSGKAIRFQ